MSKEKALATRKKETMRREVENVIVPPEGMELDPAQTNEYVSGIDIVGGYPFPRWRHKGDSGEFVSSLGEEAKKLDVVILYVQASRVYFKEFKPGSNENPVVCRSMNAQISTSGYKCHGECPFGNKGLPSEDCRTGLDVYLYDLERKSIYVMPLFRTKIFPLRQYLAKLHGKVLPCWVVTEITSEIKDNYKVPRFSYVKTLSQSQIMGPGGTQEKANEVKQALAGILTEITAASSLRPDEGRAIPAASVSSEEEEDLEDIVEDEEYVDDDEEYFSEDNDDFEDDMGDEDEEEEEEGLEFGEGEEDDDDGLFD